MKNAIMALDGGGTNLRMLITDENNNILHSDKADFGTNLSSSHDREKTLKQIQDFILNGILHIPRDYRLAALGFSSAGMEIPENKKDLEKVLKTVVHNHIFASDKAYCDPPITKVVNDIDIFLSFSDIALVAGTGTVCALKYKDIRPYDNLNNSPENSIYRFDGRGQFLGDTGAGYWIGVEVLKKVAEIENYGGFIDRSTIPYKIITPKENILSELVWEKLFKELGTPDKSAIKKVFHKYISSKNENEFLSGVYSVTEDEKKPFSRAKVGNFFSKLADDAAYLGDDTADHILKSAANELFVNIQGAYEKGNFHSKENCNLLLSGSVLVHSDITRTYLEDLIKTHYPNITISLNTKNTVWPTIEYMRNEMTTQKENTVR